MLAVETICSYLTRNDIIKRSLPSPRLLDLRSRTFSALNETSGLQKEIFYAEETRAYGDKKMAHGLGLVTMASGSSCHCARPPSFPNALYLPKGQGAIKCFKNIVFNNAVQRKRFAFNGHLYKVSFYLGKSILN